ncbi:YybH family protein [Nonomuraea sp. NPDC050547]|uniref:YybH family protein n=1 Tax=Nonomuraea sp. NPDC050547 TaxID=3364368 RepID=UPI0037987CF1
MTTRDDVLAIAAPPEEASQLAAAFAAAFNAGDAQALDRLYAEEGILLPAPGQPVTGTQRAAANRKLLSFGLPITIGLRHAYVAGDIALLIADWSICGTGCDGDRIDLRGTATDVARRGADGRWRYVIDNPLGVS